MGPEEALQRVTLFLGEFGKAVGGKGHYREIALTGSLKLGVDVFIDPPKRGHIRVHVFKVTREVAQGILDCGVAQVALSRQESCKVCAGMPPGFPAWYKGQQGCPYIGFQWHTGNDISAEDIERIQERARWLIRHFPV